MQFSPAEIIEIFSYKEDEQNDFEYLRKYMSKIKPHFQEIENDREKLKRFALIGLFLTYRACNHTGGKFTTESIECNPDSIDTKRLFAIKNFFNIRIDNELNYLRMINFSILDFLLVGLKLKSISRKFYKFVMK